MKCEDCKFWDEKDLYAYLYLGKCLAAKMVSCSTYLNEKGDKVIDKNTKLFVQDWDGHYASLFTKPDFGCVSFEPK